MYGMEWYEPFGEHYVTAISHLKATPAFKDHAEPEAVNQCKLLRKMGKNLISKTINIKPKLCAEFGVVGRSYNFIDSTVKGLVNSATTHQANNLETATLKYNQAINDYIAKESNGHSAKELRKYKVKILRLETQIVKLQKVHIYFFGKSSYYEQHMLEPSTFKKLYKRSRNNIFGARGSNDETCGNSTYQIRYKDTIVKDVIYKGSKVAAKKFVFGLTHAGVDFGTFELDGKQGLDLQRQLLANKALKVYFMRPNVERQHRWCIYVSYEMDKGALLTNDNVVSVDLNHGHIATTMISVINRKLDIKNYNSYRYDISDNVTSEAREYDIYSIIRQLVAEAKANNAKVALEYLDFEFCKKLLRNKLGATLHKLPYRKIRYKFERECAKQGVELVYVRPHYTSHLGNLIVTENSQLNRDIAAAVVIGLRALQGGNAYLNRLCMRHINDKQTKVRLNAKGKFGQHVTITGEAMGLIDTTRNTYKVQEHAGALVSEAIKQLSSKYYHNAWLKGLPTRWTCGSMDVCGKRLVKLGCRSPSTMKDNNARAKIVKFNSYLEEQFSKQEQEIRDEFATHSNISISSNAQL